MGLKGKLWVSLDDICYYKRNEDPILCHNIMLQKLCLKNYSGILEFLSSLFKVPT